MNTTQLSPGCSPWKIGDRTKHPPVDAEFLGALVGAGFLAFTGPSGLCGGKSEMRAVVAVHRGRGVRWELFFRENEADIVTSTTTNLTATTEFALAWLRGEALSIGQDCLRAAVR